MTSLRGRARRGARAHRRERRRQNDALEHPDRHLSAGPGRNRARRRAVRFTRRGMRSRSASAWSTSTSGSWRRSPSPRTSCSATIAAARRARPGRATNGVDELSERYGLAVNPNAMIWHLSVGEQQRVEILKALYRDARILILDEPTAVLAPQEADALFATLRAMAARARPSSSSAQARRGARRRRPGDRPARRQGGRDGRRRSATARSLAAMVGREVDHAHRRAPETAGRTSSPRGGRAHRRGRSRRRP